MKKLLSALFLLALCSSLAGASVPDPLNCTVTPLLGGPLEEDLVAFLAPGAVNGTTLTITVRNDTNGLIPDAAVTVEFMPEIGTCIVPPAVHTGTTGNSGLTLGVCTITLKGGGCKTGYAGACIIRANGREIKNLHNVRSPDNEGHTTSVPNGQVSTQDLGAFGDEFKGVVEVGCHDYDNNGAVNTQDLGYFGDAYKLGVTCTL